ncbi:diguanylate cyclase [Arsukibacterium ikkense]|uniref:diguanylate cyclase n=1 Tax=Arsukibacterium ikkense TaxID=336831 RepID=A0A0M2V4J6_9GAMM|nr:GGDEF domain-containing protein [Arsukibacterium ikkense]KKO44565.1 diguanylate cyclase [Arsukibacterium ikkense]
MKYQDTLQQALEKAGLVKAFLQHNQLAIHPINYAVAYDYISGNNAELCQAIEQKLASKAGFDDFIMAELYQRWLADENAEQEQLLQDVTGIVGRLSGYTDLAAEATGLFIQQLDQQLHQLAATPAALGEIAAAIKTQTHTYQQQQQQLHQQLAMANQQSHQLRHELEQLKLQKMQDPLTGLYNRIAMQNQVDIWLTEQPQRQIAAIVIDIDHFSRFNQDYGNTIGDVILSKVARKVGSYVQASGLPVRSGGEEFILLLPDVDLRTANEIAEQVRKGVEKLRFVSSRDKKSLPKITISLGVSLFQAKESWYQFLARSSQVLKLAKERGRNQVADELMLQPG